LVGASWAAQLPSTATGSVDAHAARRVLRSRPSAAVGSQSPPLTRARHTAAPMTSGTPGSGSGVSPATVAVRLSEMSRVHKNATFGICREITAS